MSMDWCNGELMVPGMVILLGLDGSISPRHRLVIGRLSLCRQVSTLGPVTVSGLTFFDRLVWEHALGLVQHVEFPVW